MNAENGTEKARKIKELLRKLDERDKPPASREEVVKKLGFTLHSSLEEAREASRRKKAERKKQIEEWRQWKKGNGDK